MEFPDYTSQELARRRQFFADFHSGRASRPLLYRSPPPTSEGWQAPEIKLWGARPRIEEVDAYLVSAIQSLAWRIESGIQDDYTFAFCLDRRWYGASQALVEPFGGELIPNVTDPNHWWAKPAVSSISEALHLKAPRRLGPHLARALELTAYMHESVDGVYPVGQICLTGPFDTASYVVGFQSLMEAVYEHPRAVHHVLDLVTDFLVTFIHQGLEATGLAGRQTEAAMAGVQGGEGWFSFCSETRAVLSDAMLAEFETPYLKRLHDEFGFQYIHSCGNWVHHMPRLAREQYAEAVDFGHPESDFRDAVKAVNGRVAVRPTTNVGNAIYQRTAEERYAEVLGGITDNTRLILDVIHENVEVFNKVYERLEAEDTLAAPLRNLGQLPAG